MSVEVTGVTVEEAIQKGLQELGVEPNQVIVEVIEEPSRGLFGLGTKQARVRLQLLAPPSRPQPPAKAVAPSVEPDSTPEPEPAVNAQVEPPAHAPAKPETAPPAPTVYHGDDDDFFDEDGNYGDDEEDFYKPAVEKRSTTPDVSPAVAEESPAEVEAEAAPEQADEDEQEVPVSESQPRESRSRNQDRSRDDRRGRGRNRRDRDSQEGGGRRQGGRNNRRRGRSQPSTVTTPPIQFNDDSESGITEQVLYEIMNIMDRDIDVVITQAEPSDRDGESGPPNIFDLKAEQTMDDLVGRRGDTLSALQYITRLIVSKQTEARANIIVDVNSYRSSRSEKLERLANRMADQAIETQRTVKMEPMPPHERRIIHIVLRKRDDVETESQGQGPDRRVTIIPVSSDE